MGHHERPSPAEAREQASTFNGETCVCTHIHAHARISTVVHDTYMHAYARTGPVRRKPANKHRHFNGEIPSPRPRGYLPPHVFLLRSCSSIPTGRGRRSAPRKQQQQHDGVAHGSRAIHRGQGVSIKPFGVTPLSLISRIYPRKNSPHEPKTRILSN